MLICLLISLDCRSQEISSRSGKEIISTSEIRALVDTGLDPRKYVKVIYRRRHDNEKSLAIWRWDTLTQHQRYRVLDNKGLINIYFDREKLAKDIKFKGNLSLSATVKSKSGERQIEVAPYSRIGVQQQTFGSNNIPPEVTARILYDVLVLMMETETQVDSAAPTFSYTPSDTSQIQLIIEEVKSKKQTDYFNKDSIERYQLLESSLTGYVAYRNPIAIEILNNLRRENYQYKTLLKDLERFNRNVKTNDEYYISQKLADARPKLLKLQNNLSTINSYLNSFEAAGEDSKDVFIRYVGKNIIRYTALKKTLEENEALLKSIISLINLEPPFSKSLIDQFRRYGTIHNLYDQTIKSLHELADYQGSEFQQAIQSSLAFQGTNPYDRMVNLRKNKDQFDGVIKRIAEQAGEYIYSSLAFATIDIAKNDLRDGDILYLYVQWKNFKNTNLQLLGRRDTLPAEKMEIGTYAIATTGWTTEVSESFYLVERINEVDRSIDQNVSPSNFKGAAGVSLMRTFNYCEPSDGKKFNKFLNWLQPSVGLNLSYIDFYTNKDLELGVAFQIGLFKNSIFLGYGVNLNSIRGGEKNGTYALLGLSFVNLAQKVKEVVSGQ
jgi:hypothetical protein